MTHLEDVYQHSLNSERHFEHKRILWIGSESYVAAAITVLQGLDTLGFEIVTIGKPNINSWWCNKVIDDPTELDFDFVLSATHWGTRWSYYDRFKLDDYPKVLIDGDDVKANETWRERHAHYVEKYVFHPMRKAKEREVSPFRWIEPLGDYQPDILFELNPQGGHYLPAGIHHGYVKMAKGKSTEQRNIDFCHIPGPGIWRDAMRDLMDLSVVPGVIHNRRVRGKPVYDTAIEEWVEKDRKRDQKGNIHSWHRWVCWSEFYEILNDSKVLIHPGIDHWPFWDCKRPYEGWASGCLVAMSQPCSDVSDYPLTEVWPDAVYDSHEQLFDRARYWYAHPDELDRARCESYERAMKYFTPEPVARYFLGKIADECN